MDSLTILVPTRNRPDELKCCLRSILNTFGPGQLVIIGDNGNTQITEAIIASFTKLKIIVLQNPEGGTYVKNIQALINACQTEWLSILHDDDLFNSGIPEIISSYIKDPTVDFIFSDHWICDANGNIDVEQSLAFTYQYERHSIKLGRQKNLSILAVKNSICLDGFYIRTALARSVTLDISSPIYSDSKWLIEICDRAQCGVYLPDRLFTYRISTVSLTNSVPPLSAHIDQWRSLQGIVVKNPATRRQLRIRQIQSIVGLIKTATKHILYKYS